MKYRIRSFLLALAVNAAFIALAAYDLRPVSCATDTECAELCPSTEPDCDGGPQ